MTPEISVIVPVYNVEKYLNQCVDSILLQSFKNIEIILVDDGSTDSSGHLCDKYEVLDKRIQVVHKENGGLSSARNAGIEIAKGKYIGFVDSDDWVHPEMYTELYETITSENVDVALGRLYKVGEKQSYYSTNLIEPQKVKISNNDMLRLLFKFEIDSSSCSKLFNIKIFSKYRFPIGKTNEDFAIMYKIFSDITNGALSNKAIYYYRDREGSITRTIDSGFHLDILINAREMINYIRCNQRIVIKEAESYYYCILLESYLNSLVSKHTDQYRISELRSEIKMNIFKIFLNHCLPLRQKVKMVILLVSPWLLIINRRNKEVGK